MDVPGADAPGYGLSPLRSWKSRGRGPGADAPGDGLSPVRGWKRRDGGPGADAPGYGLSPVRSLMRYRLYGRAGSGGWLKAVQESSTPRSESASARRESMAVDRPRRSGIRER